jgi:hypothetical protein
METAKKCFVADLGRERHLDGSNPEQEDDGPKLGRADGHFRASHRGQVLARLSRLKPGSTTTIHTMQDSHGNRFSTVPDKRQHLEEHWQQVFAAKEYQKDAGKHWFRRAYPDGQGMENFPFIDAENWQIRHSDVRRAVYMSNKSAPGPDGIPYRIW